MKVRGCERKATVQRQDHLTHAGVAVPFHSWPQRSEVKPGRAGLGRVPAGASRESLNFPSRKEEATGMFWKGRYNWVRAQGYLPSVALGGHELCGLESGSLAGATAMAPNGWGSLRVQEEGQTGFLSGNDTPPVQVHGILFYTHNSKACAT